MPKRPAGERCQTALMPCRTELRNASVSVEDILDAARSVEGLAGTRTLSRSRHPRWPTQTTLRTQYSQDISRHSWLIVTDRTSRHRKCDRAENLTAPAAGRARRPRWQPHADRRLSVRGAGRDSITKRDAANRSWADRGRRLARAARARRCGPWLGAGRHCPVQI